VLAYVFTSGALESIKPDVMNRYGISPLDILIGG